MNRKVAGNLAFGALLSISAGAAHHNGLWTSRYVDKANEDQAFRWGKLACGAIKPLPVTATRVEVEDFFKGCGYDQWCDKDPEHVFQDQSVTPAVDYMICGDVGKVAVSLDTRKTSFVKTNLVGYRLDGAVASVDSNGAPTQVFSHPEELDSNKLFSALSGSDEACSIYIDPISKKIQEDVSDAMAFNVQTLLSVAPTGALDCDKKIPATSPRIVT